MNLVAFNIKINDAGMKYIRSIAKEVKLNYYTDYYHIKIGKLFE